MDKSQLNQTKISNIDQSTVTENGFTNICENNASRNSKRMNESNERQKLFFNDIVVNSRDKGNDELALFKRTAYFAQSDNQAK